MQKPADQTGRIFHLPKNPGQPDYLVSRCRVCDWQNLQYFLNSILSGLVRLFFVVE